MKALRVQPLTAESFAPYGKVLAKPEGVAPAFDREDFKGWVGVADLAGYDPEQAVWSLLRVNRHQMPVNKLERHCVCPETFIPLTGSAVLVVAPPSDPADPDARPDESKIAAFLLDGSAGVLFPPGGWHWVPFAISETMDILVLLQKNLDIDVRDIEQRTLELY